MDWCDATAGCVHLPQPCDCRARRRAFTASPMADVLVAVVLPLRADEPERVERIQSLVWRAVTRAIPEPKNTTAPSSAAAATSASASVEAEVVSVPVSVPSDSVTGAATATATATATDTSSQSVPSARHSASAKKPAAAPIHTRVALVALDPHTGLTIHSHFTSHLPTLSHAVNQLFTTSQRSAWQSEVSAARLPAASTKHDSVYRALSQLLWLTGHGQTIKGAAAAGEGSGGWKVDRSPAVHAHLKFSGSDSGSGSGSGASDEAAAAFGYDDSHSQFGTDSVGSLQFRQMSVNHILFVLDPPHTLSPAVTQTAATLPSAFHRYLIGASDNAAVRDQKLSALLDKIGANCVKREIGLTVLLHHAGMHHLSFRFLP
jgi:hypothetical protein